MKNYTAEIIDINGTWQPDVDYQAFLELSEEEMGRLRIFEEEFSWGTGMRRPYRTFNIDITASEPFLRAMEDRLLVTKITQAGKDAVKVNAYYGRLDDPDYCWFIDFVFHFNDKDTMWIECEYFEERDRTNGNYAIYGKGALWHRMSGPDGYYRWGK
jgi:hypothetical protein